jgi:hypothetical protein
MRKLLKTNIEGIKSKPPACDAPGCGWDDSDNINWDGDDMDDVRPIIANWLNKPCPKCGANLLTEADAKTFLAWCKFSSIVNKYFGWFLQIPSVFPAFIVGLFVGTNFGSNGLVLFMGFVFVVFGFAALAQAKLRDTTDRDTTKSTSK